MEQDNQHRIYKEGDVDSFIAKFGQKPPQEVRQRTREELAWQKEKFLALENVQQNKQQKVRGQHR